MKHTLETIKKALNQHSETQDAVSFGLLKHEIEGFEKQEKERLRCAQDRLENLDQTEGKQEADVMWEQGYIQAKKETLG